MKNIPIFTTENGIASPILEEISFNKTAYIRIQNSLDPEALVQECVTFCRAVGAENIYASGIDRSEGSTSVLRMSRSREGLGDSAAALVKVTSTTVELFRKIYNDGMRAVQNASGMTTMAANDVLIEGTGYFVYQDSDLIGIGIAKEQWVRAIVSLRHGMGESIMLALNRVLEGERVYVEVINTNRPAMNLYKRMGFIVEETISTWYKIFSLSSENT